MTEPLRTELAALLQHSLGDRATELLMAELPEPGHDDEHANTNDGLDARIEGMRAHMDQQFAAVRDNFADVDRRLEQVQSRLDGVETSILVLTERIDTDFAKTEALVLREITGLRADMISQTRSLFIGIPSMVGAMAVFVLGLAQFTLH